MWTGETSEISSFFSPSIDQPTPFLGAKKTLSTLFCDFCLIYKRTMYNQFVYCIVFVIGITK